MGNTVWILTQDTKDDNWDHSLILANEKALDKLAEQVGVRKLSAFYDHSILAEEYGEEIEPNYVSPKELTNVISNLITVIKEGNADQLNGDNELIGELEDCLKKVLMAADQGLEVRVAIVP